MTSCLISVALIFTPAPLTAPKEAPQWPINVLPESVVSVTPPTTSFVVLPTSATTLVVEVGMPANGAPMTSISEPVEPTNPPTPIEAALNRLTELGASPWQLRTFGCLAWYESRNNPYAVSPTGDYGILQINRRFHAWRWAGRDIYDPVVNAEVAWDIYRESGWRAWMTARLCGV